MSRVWAGLIHLLATGFLYLMAVYTNDEKMKRNTSALLSFRLSSSCSPRRVHSPRTLHPRDGLLLRLPQDTARELSDHSAGSVQRYQRGRDGIDGQSDLRQALSGRSLVRNRLVSGTGRQ